jgi:hypothetical protein
MHYKSKTETMIHANGLKLIGNTTHRWSVTWFILYISRHNQKQHVHCSVPQGWIRLAQSADKKKTIQKRKQFMSFCRMNLSNTVVTVMALVVGIIAQHDRRDFAVSTEFQYEIFWRGRCLFCSIINDFLLCSETRQRYYCLFGVCELSELFGGWLTHVIVSVDYE